MGKKIGLIGTAYPLRGGLAAYNERLVREFNSLGDQAKIYTFSLQYPAFLFPGRTQYSTSPAPPDLDIKVCINSINPFNWIKVGLALRRDRPDLIVIKFWLPFMGACFGTILRIARWKRPVKVVCIADNIIPHEKRFGDRPLTKYFIKSCDAFIAMSDKVFNDLRLFTTKPATKIEHPLYDHFGDPIQMREARAKLGLPQEEHIVLFFGFIRKYKGLDLLLEAVRQVPDARFVIAGEYYEDGQFYEDLIDRLGIRDRLVLKTDFIPDEDVKYYLCAADVLVQPYRAATQSGVTPLAYHFECPMVVTNVGGLPDLVPDGKVGIVCEPQPESIANAIKQFYTLGRAHFLPGLREEKKKYSWKRLVEAIRELTKNTNIAV
ncbi:glycosyltransferase [Dinghuibacter silviterrae]|uniref:Glycosyltransferase involved in cell wall biosynthesis n=1 Tax=Dinghuibacter silviterrae TaxID=1539049 RepID=A0A4R8DW59_9BACT|nr:glycosyltransferase [Dinghuibacter silviterrae]TDX02306.1 glycosyltransferase involved in cell wall biosynthesis [Dinghuibacter silviterrae]